MHVKDWIICLLIPGEDLLNWGPQANIEMGPYTFAHIYKINLEVPFCRDACCCTVVPHSVQCFYIFHVRVIMGFFHLHLHLFI